MIERRMSMLLIFATLIADVSCSFTVFGGTGSRSTTFHTSNSSRRKTTRHPRPPMTMYMPANGPTTQTPSLTAQQMLKNPGHPQIKDMAPKTSNLQLSNSVLASCDTLPSFPTAHGLLSPETVVRMEQLTFAKGGRGRNNKALLGFIKTYRRHGPLSCLPMLSDPDILPHLTEAMRDIASE